MQVLFTYDYGKEQMDSIRELGYEVLIKAEKGLEYDDSLKDVEVLACYDPFTTLDISKMKKLKWIQLSSIGIDQLPIEVVRKNHIIITNNKGGYSIPIGEWIVLKVLELLKRSYDLYVNQLNKTWKLKGNVLELYGKTIGFVGTGSLAKEAAKRFQGFGVKLLGVNTNGRATEYFKKCFALNNMESMLSQCDVVVLTIPSTAKTYHLINEEIINKMKKGVYIINVSRGEIVEEKALITALQDEKIAGAALDVFEEEPLSLENELWSLKNVIITPHNSWVSEQRNNRRFQLIYENLSRYAEGKSLSSVVDLEKGY